LRSHHNQKNQLKHGNRDHQNHLWHQPPRCNCARRTGDCERERGDEETEQMTAGVAKKNRGGRSIENQKARASACGNEREISH
jgi:hypothetical protein